MNNGVFTTLSERFSESVVFLCAEGDIVTEKMLAAGYTMDVIKNN